MKVQDDNARLNGRTRYWYALPPEANLRLPVIRKDGYVEVCVFEIYRDKPVLGSDLWHDFVSKYDGVVQN